jgi:uncharacterized protein (DUF1015 family)
VTTVRPFPGLVVRQDWASRVVSPMHDALAPEERAAIRAANPDSYLHVTRRTDDPDSNGGPDALATESRAALNRLLEAGAFRSFPRAGCFVYRLAASGHIQTGVVAEVPVAAFESGDVRGHEDVDPGRVEALELHLEGVPARSDPVAIMHRPHPEVSGVIKGVVDREPVVRIGSPDDLEQIVWHLEETEGLGAVTAGLAEQILYVADGHHRVAASIAAWERAGRPPGAGILCVLFPTDELQVLAFHRLINGPIDPMALRRALDERFVLDEIVRPDPSPGSFDVYLEGRWSRAMRRDPSRPEGAAGLDVARLQDEVLGPMLGVHAFGDPRLEYTSDLVPRDELVTRCDAAGGVLFLLHPPSVDELMDVADRGDTVVPKSTYFHPKPRSGVFLRLVD